MPRKKTNERTGSGPRRGDYVLVEDSVVRVGGDGLPDLEPRHRVMVVGRVRRGAVVEVVSPEQHVPGDAKAETGRTAEFNTVYPLPDDALERLGGIGVSEVGAQSWDTLDDAWAWISGEAAGGEAPTAEATEKGIRERVEEYRGDDRESMEADLKEATETLEGLRRSPQDFRVSVGEARELEETRVVLERLLGEGGGDLEALAEAWGNGDRPVADEPGAPADRVDVADEPAEGEAEGPAGDDEPSDEAERPADGRDIACPECGVAPGKSCRYPSGYYYSRGHTSRRPGGVAPESGMVDDARLDMECPECLAEAGKPCRVVLVRGHAARR